MLTTVELQKIPSHFLRYVEHVRTLDFIDALSESSARMQEFLKTVPEAKGTYRYAEGKWSIKEVLTHLMDAERIFAYRALRFAQEGTYCCVRSCATGFVRIHKAVVAMDSGGISRVWLPTWPSKPSIT